MSEEDIEEIEAAAKKDEFYHERAVEDVYALVHEVRRLREILLKAGLL